MKRSILVAVLTVVAMPVMAEDTPEHVVSACWEGINASNFTAAAKYVLPTELAKIRDLVIPSIEKGVGTNQVPPFLRSFMHDDTVESIAKLTPEEVFVRVMSLQFPALQQMKRSSTAPIGVVAEGAAVHVVCRQTMPGMDTNSARVVVYTTTKDKGDWKLSLPEVQIAAQMLSRQASMGSMMRPSMSPTRTQPPSFGPIMPRDQHTPKPPETAVTPPATTPATPPAIPPAIPPAKPVEPATTTPVPAPAAK